MTILLAVDDRIFHDFPETDCWEPRAVCGYVGRAPQLLFPHGERCTPCPLCGCASLPVVTASPGGRASTSTGPECFPPAAGPVGFQ